MVSCSSLARYKSSWRSYHCTTCSDGRRLLELQLWFVGPPSHISVVADRPTSDHLSTVEHVYR